MFIVAMSTIAKPGKEPKCLPTGEWTKKMWDTHTHTHRQGNTTQPSKNKILPLATTWTKPEGIMPSKISQSEKDNYTISLIYGI